LKQILFGAVIGIANIIPGVSGGTFALILGIYPRLLEALGSYNASYAKTVLSWFKQPGWPAFKTLVFTAHFRFLSTLLIGAVGAILLLSQGLKFSLENYYSATYGFFLGLILCSIPIPYRLLESKRPTAAVWLIVGVCLTLFISIQVDPSTNLLEKSRHYQLVLEGARTGSAVSYAAAEYASIFFVGILAISAMVLPGISGSFVLLLSGDYYPVIAAISRVRHFYMEDIFYLCVFAAGNLVGLLVFVRIFNFLFARFKDQTIFLLIGLMVGSLYALWPFKEYQLVDLYMKSNSGVVLIPGYRLYGNHLTWWTGTGELATVLLTFVLGCVVMLLFNRYDKGKGSSALPGEA
jgi:putative membrane protein